MNIEIIKYSLILMGQYNSTIDLDFYGHQWNRLEAPNAWKHYPPKNEEYYKGKRFCKISRKFYPQFTPGWLWGRYENEDYYKELGYRKNNNDEWILDEEMVERERDF